MAKEDFADDTKDAGELGSGHTVTALYEIIPADSDEVIPGVDELKYQESSVKQEAYSSLEIMMVKLRYKEPDGDTSMLITQGVHDSDLSFEDASENFRFACSVAAFGMLLRDSEYKGSATYDLVIMWARNAKGKDPEGYRAEFVKLVEMAALLAK